MFKKESDRKICFEVLEAILSSRYIYVSKHVIFKIYKKNKDIMPLTRFYQILRKMEKYSLIKQYNVGYERHKKKKYGKYYYSLDSFDSCLYKVARSYRKIKNKCIRELDRKEKSIIEKDY